MSPDSESFQKRLWDAQAALAEFIRVLQAEALFDQAEDYRAVLSGLAEGDVNGALQMHHQITFAESNGAALNDFDERAIEQNSSVVRSTLAALESCLVEETERLDHVR